LVGEKKKERNKNLETNTCIWINVFFSPTKQGLSVYSTGGGAVKIS
jgi:hypothetical protein